MVKLNDNELLLYNHVCASRKDVPIKELIALFYKGRKKPKHPHGSMAAMMRTIALKTRAMGMSPLRRTSRLGVGSTATYMVGQ
jgi:hypothetical protein